MPKKKLVFIFLVIVAIIIVFGYFTTKQSDKITIQTSAGDIPIKNIYKNPVENVSEKGVSFAEDNSFHISFYPQDQGFVITILSADVNNARIQAETSFMNSLGINKAQACALKVSLTVPFGVNPDLAGTNYGLSFCPNGKPFPNQ